ncbi:phasin family protein [Betaproteobacteria bacterium]|nr:phasin family protein [Betaproteobacteria bacterium]
MTSFPDIEYYSTFCKKFTKNLSDFSEIAFEKFVQANDYNIKYTKSTLDNTNNTLAAMLEIKDPQKVVKFSQNSIKPVSAKLTDYFKEIYKINSDFLKSGSQYVESESEEMNKIISDQVEEMSKNAPAGTEGVVAITKSSVATSISIYDSITKAAKQVFEIVDNNIDAASKVSESVASGSNKTKSKKAA